MPPDAARPRAVRGDATRNRERILAAAGTLVDADAALRMADVARTAGVGQGTLYRHFPTREDLLLTVYREQVAQVAAPPPASGDPVADLRAWIDGLVAYGRVRQALAAVALPPERSSAVRDEWRPRVLAALQRLIAAAQSAGDVRADVDAEDVWDLLAFLWTGPALPAGRRDRLVDVLLRGLRPAGRP